jgi:ribosomal protein L24
MSNRFKPKYNIKKGDSVVVIAGDDKDVKKPRTVLEVIIDEGRVVVEGRKYHHKTHQAFRPQHQGRYCKKGSPHTHKQCYVVGCEGRRGRQSTAHPRKREISTSIKKIWGGY